MDIYVAPTCHVEAVLDCLTAYDTNTNVCIQSILFSQIIIGFYVLVSVSVSLLIDGHVSSYNLVFHPKSFQMLIDHCGAEGKLLHLMCRVLCVCFHCFLSNNTIEDYKSRRRNAH